QDLFGQLAVFHGNFDAAAAQAIADGHDDPADVTRLLLYLVDRSLVTAELDGGTTSYRLLETLRSYGLERLAEQGRLDAARARHARWAAHLVTRAERGLRGADEASWAASVERHFGDLRAAHSWLADTDPELGLQMAAQLHWYALRGRRRPPSPVGGAATPASRRHRIPRPRRKRRADGRQPSHPLRAGSHSTGRHEALTEPQSNRPMPPRCV
ncbi:MAG: hypothetical protein ACHP9Z_30270, partial [Streptosporangiales bacterium]